MHWWQTAAQDFQKAIELGLDSPDVLFADGRLRIASNDVAGYRDACKRLIRRFEHAKNPVFLRTVAHILSLSPVNNDLSGQAVELAQKAVDAGNNDGDRFFRLSTLGAAFYRAGRFQEARKTLENVEAANYSSVWNQLFLAMTTWRSGGRDQALEILKKATGEIQEQFETRPYSVNWYEWLETTVLQTEVLQMLITIS